MTTSFAEISGRLQIALTRQEGENGKLRHALEKAFEHGGIPTTSINVVDIPCIEHACGKDFASLEASLAALAPGGDGKHSGESHSGPSWDLVTLTSPEAARVFLRAWGRSSPLPIPLVCVGKGTSSVVQSAGMSVAFEPSLANAETLAAELPLNMGPRVLYPASDKAKDTLEHGLAARGFTVERLNTYTTRAVQQPTPEMLTLMRRTDVATFGSPSAVKAWMSHAAKHPVAACIGGTSRDAALAANFPHIYSPSKPGIAGWADATLAAVRALNSFSSSTCL
eukprot:CAMPEP_0172762930 /NCGR_PEP_ID=MMETSP1074-20121228/174420_1 /TAXON_ID=2916 /ORGANISM="Ceratium fusus, Strain PA161109" /LENGTH=280 /DNA_ID=CAMNT_0013597409 /DNA_START=129 /DNA_END=971 /DNA_ORIENTATION=-